MCCLLFTPWILLKMSKHHFLPLLIVFCAPLLASCSTITNGSTQQVSFKSVGADDVSCDILIGANDYKYSVRPPNSIWVQRSRKPMFIACTAPGNRTKNVVVESGITNTAYLNTLTAGTTLAVDAETGAMYSYPEEVIIDFSSALSKDQPLPSYENKGALDPTAQGIEYMGPDTPALQGDKEQAARYKAAYDDAARQDELDAANTQERARRIEAVEGGFYGDKGLTPDVPVRAVPKANNKEVQVAPLSDAAPANGDGKTLTAKPITQQDNGTFVPQTNHQLGKPMFPSSTTF